MEMRASVRVGSRGAERSADMLGQDCPIFEAVMSEVALVLPFVVAADVCALRTLVKVVQANAWNEVRKDIADFRRSGDPLLP